MFWNQWELRLELQFRRTGLDWCSGLAVQGGTYGCAYADGETGRVVEPGLVRGDWTWDLNLDCCQAVTDIIAGVGQADEFSLTRLW